MHCVLISIGVRMYTCMLKPEVNVGNYSSAISILHFKTGSLGEPEVHHVG